MIKYFVLSFFLTISTLQAQIDVEGKKLSSNWALEVIGADIVKLQMRGFKTVRVPLAIFDTGFEKDYLELAYDIDVALAFNGHRRVIGHHGTSVAHLINGKSENSVSELVDYVMLKSVQPAIFYNSAVRQALNLEQRPWIISNSVGWRNENIIDLAKQVDDEGIIWLLASGNAHPEPMPDHESQAPVTLVGSVSPYGIESLTSQTSDELKLLAPSDNYLPSLDGLGRPTLFGGTSGATPIVAATMANLKSIRPSLTRGQLERLLYANGFDLLHSHLDLHERPSRLINAYKTLQRLLELESECAGDDNCFETQIDLPYIQKMRAPTYEQVRDFCEGRGEISEEVLRELRKDFLLSAPSRELGELLSCAYRRLNLEMNAEFYENLVLNYYAPEKVLEKIQTLNHQSIRKGHWQNPSLRELSFFGPSSIEALEEILTTNEGIGTFRARRYLQRLGFFVN